MEFAIQINVGESSQEALENALKANKMHERGEKFVARQLGVRNWDEIYALFSPAGLLLIESFVKSHKDICDDKFCDRQPIDPTNLNADIKVSDLKEFDPAEYINNAQDVMLYLKLALEDNDPKFLADALNVISRSRELAKLNENNESSIKF